MAGLFRHFSKSQHVFAVDLPGHGETPLRRTPALLDAFTASLSGFLKERGLFVGHSMGGMLSALAAGRQPERVAGVINQDGALPLRLRLVPAAKGLFARIKAGGFRPVVACFLKEAFFLPHERGPLCEQIVLEMLSLPEDLAVSLMSQFPGLDAGKALTACRLPLLCIGSSFPRFDQSVLAQIQPPAWIARVALSGHFVQMFALPQVIAMTEKFLESGITAGSDSR
jgi:pimeloyl-ACP methyl ester carboxylesterase